MCDATTTTTTTTTTAATTPTIPLTQTLALALTLPPTTHLQWKPVGAVHVYLDLTAQGG